MAERFPDIAIRTDPSARDAAAAAAKRSQAACERGRYQSVVNLLRASDFSWIRDSDPVFCFRNNVAMQARALVYKSGNSTSQEIYVYLMAESPQDYRIAQHSDVEALYRDVRFILSGAGDDLTDVYSTVYSREDPHHSE
ncbi:MAG: hypothetical protein AAF909_15660 [Pseudomonadota bacterium]